MENEDRPPVRIQPAEGPPDGVANRDIVGNRRPRPDRLEVERHGVDGDLMDTRALPPAKRGPTGIDRDPPQPGLEAAVLAQPRQLAPRPQAALLDGVPRVRLVSDDRHREPQQSLNRRWTDEAVLAQARGPVGGLMDVKSERTFALADTTAGDVVGIEYVGPLRKNPTAVLFMSLALTPRGRLMMNCLVRDGQADQALPMLRSIRDTIRPPK